MNNNTCVTCTALIVIGVILCIVLNAWFIIRLLNPDDYWEADLTNTCTDEMEHLRKQYEITLSNTYALQDSTKQLEVQLELVRNEKQIMEQKYYDMVSDSKNADGTLSVVEKKKNPFTVEIKLLTYNRFESVKRCLESLRNANYEGDSVELTIYIDHFAPKPTMSQEEHNKLLKTNRQILDLATNFNWPFGKKYIHYRQANAHLQFQWIESFYPLDNDTYAFIVEDDITVSPFYYQYLKKMLFKYRYSGNVDPHIYGISFQKQKLVPGFDSGVRMANVFNGNQPFLYHLVGTWGQIVFPEHWREFRQYYDERRYREDAKPFLKGMITNQWYEISGEKIWTPWIIRWAMARNYYNLYANFGMRALSVSHRDGGVNYNKTMGPDSLLITASNDPTFPAKMRSTDLTPSEKLARYDYCFKIVPRGKLLNAQDVINTPLTSANNKILTLLVVDTAKINFLYNQLCVFEQMIARSMEQSVRSDVYFYVKDSELARDLAYRGFNVILNQNSTLADFVKSVQKDGMIVINQNNNVLLSNGVSGSLDLRTSYLSEIADWIFLNSQDKNSWQPLITSNLDDFQSIYSVLDNSSLKRKKVSITVVDGLILKPAIISSDTTVKNEHYIIENHDNSCKFVKCKR
jgi:hypothetical protein